MSTESRALVERAIGRTRKNAATQLGIGALVTASFVIWYASPVFTAVFLGMNSLVMYFLGRRWWRLRQSGNAVRALLDDPGQVASVYSWPRKLPPNRAPVMLDVFTHGGEQCTLLLDGKNPQETSALVDALHTRSPDAIVDVPNLPQARLA